MSVLGLMENTADIAQTTPDLSALPSTNVDRMGAAWDAAQSPDRYWNVQGARKERADKIIDDLHAMTGERLKNPYDNSPTQDEIRENLGQPTTVIYAKRLEALREKTRNARAGIEQFGGLPQDYLDVDSIDASIASESGARRARDERMTGTGGGFGGFLGAAGGEMFSPHGIMTSFIPVSRMPTAIVETTIAGFARNIGKEALLQGGAQGAAQSLATLVDYQTRKQFGTEQTNAQILEEISSAAGGGALLGGAFRATHLGILKLASRGVEIPPAVLDAARVQEGAELYGNKNPLRVEPAAHETAQDQATGAAMVGRAATPEVDVPVAAVGGPPAPAGTIAYHGTGRTFENFDMKYQSQNAIFLTDRADIAQRHAGGAGRVLKAELSIDNPREVDWGGGLYNTERMNDLIREAKADGHDGLIIKNIKDFSVGETSTTYAVFKPESARIMPEAAGARAAAEAAPPVPAAEAEKAVADARLQGAAAAEAAPGEPPVIREVPPATIADQLPDRAIERLGNVLEGNNNQPIRLLDFDPSVVAALEEAGFAKDGIMTVRQFNEMVTARQSREAAIQQAEQAAELQRLTKSVEEHPDNPMQAPRTTPEVAPQPATAKAAGESAEDKAVLQQAQQVLDSETLTKIDPAAKSKMDQIDMEVQQAKAAVACLAGAL